MAELIRGTVTYFSYTLQNKLACSTAARTSITSRKQD